MPDIINKAGLISFNGNFTGYINDFVTYGTFNSDLGTIKADFSLKPESKTRIYFNGKLVAFNFALGKLVQQENILGKANINFTADGTIEDNKKVSGNFEGNINNFEFYGYTYSDILLKGSLIENNFDGSVLLEDPNIKLNLLGQGDFSKKIPEFNFTADLINAKLHKLKIIKSDSVFNVTCKLNAKFKGTKFENVEGEINLKQACLQRLNKTLNISDFSIYSQKDGLKVISDFIDGDISGARDFKNFIPSLISVFKKYLPDSFHRINLKENATALNRFKFDIIFKNINPILDFITEGAVLSRNSRLTGNYFPPDSAISFVFNSDFFQTGANRFENLNIELHTHKDSMVIVLNSSKAFRGSQFNLGKLNAKSVIKNDSIFTKIDWLNKDTINSQINLLAYFFQNSSTQHPILNVRLFPTQVFFIDSIWKLDEASISIDTSSIAVSGFKLIHNRQEFYLKGKVTENPTDTTIVEFKNFDLKNLGFLIKNDKLLFNGKLNGNAVLSDLYHQRHLIASLNIDSLSINNEILGKTNMDISWNNLQQKIIVSADAYKSDNHTLHVEGDYLLPNKELDFKSTINNVSLLLFQPLIGNTFTLEKGSGSGYATLTGDIYKPLLNAVVDIDNAKLMINYLKTSYNFNTKLSIQDNKFVFSNIKMVDKYKKLATVNGFISNKYLKDFYFNLKISLDNNLVLNTNAKDNALYYGKGFASGLVNIYGPAKNITIDMQEVITGKNSIIYIPLNKRADIVENNFLTFTGQEENYNKEVPLAIQQYDASPSGTSISLNLDITPDAEIQLVFDPKIGDIMHSQGQGNIKIEINPTGNFNIRGDYVIESGEYLFTLQNLINKKFVLEPGGVISWNGNPTDANIDIKAVYHMKAALYNLLVDQAPEYKKRIPVDCQLFIKGKLMNPEIRYDIYLPNTTEETRNKVKDAINTDEELSRQFLMLLVTNNFFPNLNSTSTDVTFTSSGSEISRNIATTTSYELLSNQFSNWISQVSKDFDVGFNYRPGEKNITSDEVEVALSTQLLNDHVSINGNLDVVGSQTNNVNSKTNNLVGDVNVDVKLTDNGKLRLRAFNRVNDQILTEESLYTQGVGLLYREEFSNFGDLISKYFYELLGKKKYKPMNQNADSTSKSNNHK